MMISDRITQLAQAIKDDSDGGLLLFELEDALLENGEVSDDQLKMLLNLLLESVEREWRCEADFVLFFHNQMYSYTDAQKEIISRFAWNAFLKSANEMSSFALIEIVGDSMGAEEYFSVASDCLNSKEKAAYLPRGVARIFRRGGISENVLKKMTAMLDKLSTSRNESAANEAARVLSSIRSKLP